MSVCIDISFLRDPRWAESKSDEADFGFYQQCAELSLRMDNKPISDQNVADKTSRLLDIAHDRALVTEQQNGYFTFGMSSDLRAKEAMRNDMLARVDNYNPAQNGGRMLAFFITPETRALVAQHAEAVQAAMRPASYDL